MIPVSEKAKVPTAGTAETAAGISARLKAPRDNQSPFMGTASVVPSYSERRRWFDWA